MQYAQRMGISHKMLWTSAIYEVFIITSNQWRLSDGLLVSKMVCNLVIDFDTYQTVQTTDRKRKENDLFMMKLWRVEQFPSLPPFFSLWKKASNWSWKSYKKGYAFYIEVRSYYEMLRGTSTGAFSWWIGIFCVNYGLGQNLDDC